jgi:signal transduction histidine kinase
VSRADLESKRVVILTPSGRDAALTRDLLAEVGVESVVATDVDDLCAKLDEGAGSAVIASEALSADARSVLSAWLRRQPPWSDFPIVVLAHPAREGDGPISDRLTDLGDVHFLERPVRVRTMVSAVRSALRARARQYAARRAIRSRDEFLAMMGHELRNPLGAVSLAAELMRETDDAEGRERQRTIIARQAQHLARLVDDLLDIARITHGKIVLRTAPLNLGDVVDAVVEAAEGIARESGIELTVDVDPALSVLGDRVRLEQVFSNLLTNALKYTPPGGAVRVTARGEDGRAVVRVSDSGIGLEPEMLERVFDAFIQADQGAARSRGGMGLGLAVVRSLVGLHGGEVIAESEGSGKGTSFTVSLPRMEARSPAEDATPAGASAEKKRVVIVEDSEDHRTLLADLLERRGHEVTVACDGPEGLERILEKHPDLAMIDIGLPGFDGLELARRVRAAGQTDVVLVALTGYGQQQDKADARAAGFDVHLTKPVDRARVEAVLHAHR